MDQLDYVRGRQVVLPLTNKSGGTRVEGDVVILDVSNDDAFTRTNSAGNEHVLGIVTETIADNAVGRVITQGYAPVVTVTGATARGDFLKTSTTLGKSAPTANIYEGVFAVALTLTGGAGTVSAYLFGVDSGRQPDGVVYLTAEQGWPSTTNGCAAPAKTEHGVNDVDVYTMDFDPAADEFAQWTTLLPLWDAGNIDVRFFWTCSGGGAAETVRWQVQGFAYPDNTAIDSAWGVAKGVLDTWQADDTVHITGLIQNILLGGTPAAGSLVQIRAYRDVSEDDLVPDAQLLAIAIYYTKA